MLTLDEIRTKLEVANIKALGSYLNIHRNTLYRVVNGGSCNANTLEKLSTHFESHKPKRKRHTTKKELSTVSKD